MFITHLSFDGFGLKQHTQLRDNSMVHNARGRHLVYGDHVICTDARGFRMKAAPEDPAGLPHAEAVAFGNGTKCKTKEKVRRIARARGEGIHGIRAILPILRGVVIHLDSSRII
jgi:hypothetical protein